MKRLIAFSLLMVLAAFACDFRGNDLLGESCEYEIGYSTTTDSCSPGLTCTDFSGSGGGIPESHTGRCRMRCVSDADCAAGCSCADDPDGVHSERPLLLCRTSVPTCEPGACGPRPGLCGDSIHCGPCPDAGRPDSGLADAGLGDAGQPDAGLADAGP